MVRFAWLAVVVAALAACSGSGRVHDGYDEDSPAASQIDSCSRNPPSGHCNSPGSN